MSLFDVKDKIRTVRDTNTTETQIAQSDSAYFDWQEFTYLLNSNPYLKEILTPTEKDGKGYNLVAQRLIEDRKVCFYIAEKNWKVYYLIAQLSKVDEKVCFYVDEDTLQKLLHEKVHNLSPEQRKKFHERMRPQEKLLPQIEQQHVINQPVSKIRKFTEHMLLTVLLFFVGIAVGAFWLGYFRPIGEKTTTPSLSSLETNSSASTPLSLPSLISIDSKFYVFKVFVVDKNGFSIPRVDDVYACNPGQTLIIKVKTDMTDQYEVVYWAAEGSVHSDGSYIVPELPGGRDMVTVKIVDKNTENVLGWNIIKIKIVDINRKGKIS